MNRLPQDCTTMAEVRAGVDALDRQIVALLAERFRFMHAAARIKSERDQVRDEWRKADVLAKVAAAAAQAGLAPELIESLYDQLVETSIAYELDEFDRLRTGD